MTVTFKEEILRELRLIPGIGTACANDLYLIGIHSISDLRNQNPRHLYEKLNAVTHSNHDICMLYTFRCAVYFASEKKPAQEKLKWWYWKNKKYKEK